ncbi:MAG TPA: biotin/lipoyl-binding protein [Candidatus Paceibacterota bacterium]|nr:biotin/lipoyl-binding protein [Candidatus Paceibacterota bacterium]
MKTFLKKWLKNKYVIIGLILVVVIVLIVISRSGKASTLQSVAATRGNVVEQVSVTGQVLPVNKADLSFEKGGVVTDIYVKVGDKVSKGDIIASLDNATDEANLASAQATLDDMTRALRPQELNADQSQVNAAGVTLANAKQDALNAARTGYVAAQGAVANYSDTFFMNAQSANPTINIATVSQDNQKSINFERVQVSDALTGWQNALAQATSSDSAEALLTNAEGYSNTIKNFMNDLSVIINSLSPNNSGVSQAQINADVADMNSALNGLSQAITAVIGAETELQSASSSYQEANNNFILENAGDSEESIAAQMAKVDAAQAELDQDTILSPIDGIVTVVAPDVGDYVSPGDVSFSVIGSSLEIQAYVAEADIAKVAIGNLASTTLDAYGSDIDFPSQVIAIDPAETVLEGVPTYKVTLDFIKNDPRILSGMTANLEILTHEEDNVLTIPYRAIIDNDGAFTVRVMNPDGTTYKTVSVVAGLKGSDGTIEIISGLTLGQKVVTYIQGQ